MLKRLNEIAGFSDKDREHILYTLDAMIKELKLKGLLFALSKLTLKLKLFFSKSI
jgi:hypothetical protein